MVFLGTIELGGGSKYLLGDVDREEWLTVWAVYDLSIAAEEDYTGEFAEYCFMMLNYLQSGSPSGL